MNGNDLETVLGLADISQSEWNACKKDERRDKFKRRLNQARLKYHSDRRPRGLSESDNEAYEQNIKLLNAFFEDDNYQYTVGEAPSTSQAAMPNARSQSTPQGVTPKSEDFFKEFLDKVKSEMGADKRFKNWQSAFQHYFKNNIKDTAQNNYHDIYQHQQATQNFEAEFLSGLERGIYNRFVIPGSRNEVGASGEYLRPSFRCEAELLVKICKFQRHIGFEDTVVRVASKDLLSDENFWRAAIIANPKAMNNLHLTQHKSYERDALVTASVYDILTNDADFMRSLIEIDPQNIRFLGSELSDNEGLLSLAVLREPTSTMRVASARLKNILSSLAQTALQHNAYDAIEHITFDKSAPDEKSAYLSVIERAWESLPQKSVQSVYDFSSAPSFERFARILKEPFKTKAESLSRQTDKLILELKKNIDQTSRQSSTIFSSAYGFFTHTLVGSRTPATPEELSRELKNFLNYLEGNKGFEMPSIENLKLLRDNPLPESVNNWMNAKQDLLGDDDNNLNLSVSKSV